MANSKSMTTKTLTAVVALGVGAYIGFGINNAIPPKKNPNISAYNGVIVQLGGAMNISKEGIDSIFNWARNKKN